MLCCGSSVLSTVACTVAANGTQISSFRASSPQLEAKELDCSGRPWPVAPSHLRREGTHRPGPPLRNPGRRGLGRPNRCLAGFDPRPPLRRPSLPRSWTSRDSLVHSLVARWSCTAALRGGDRLRRPSTVGWLILRLRDAGAGHLAIAGVVGALRAPTPCARAIFRTFWRARYRSRLRRI